MIRNGLVNEEPPWNHCVERDKPLRKCKVISDEGSECGTHATLLPCWSTIAIKRISYSRVNICSIMDTSDNKFYANVINLENDPINYHNLLMNKCIVLDVSDEFLTSVIKNRQITQYNHESDENNFLHQSIATEQVDTYQTDAASEKCYVQSITNVCFSKHCQCRTITGHNNSPKCSNYFINAIALDYLDQETSMTGLNSVNGLLHNDNCLAALNIHIMDVSHNVSELFICVQFKWRNIFGNHLKITVTANKQNMYSLNLTMRLKSIDVAGLPVKIFTRRNIIRKVIIKADNTDDNCTDNIDKDQSATTTDIAENGKILIIFRTSLFDSRLGHVWFSPRLPHCSAIRRSEAIATDTLHQKCVGEPTPQETCHIRQESTCLHKKRPTCDSNLRNQVIFTQLHRRRDRRSQPKQAILNLKYSLRSSNGWWCSIIYLLQLTALLAAALDLGEHDLRCSFLYNCALICDKYVFVMWCRCGMLCCVM